MVTKNQNIEHNKSVFIIAELSANHLHKYEIAEKTLISMKESGADAVKLQTYTADTLTIDCDNEYFRIKQGTLWDGKNLYKLYKEAYTPWEWHPKLQKLANEIGLIFFSSPFDKTSVDFLETLNIPIYKVASFEITDIPLIEYIAQKGKPIIFSTGIATLQEIEEAIAACKKYNNHDISLLKCTSAYPAPLDEINLKTIPDMKKKFQTKVGLSDHTLSLSVAISAVALGAEIIEKHFILDRALGGPDAAFSCEPAEFKYMVNGIRDAEKAMGHISYELSEKMKKNRNFSRSLFVVKDIKKGELFTESNVRSIRPGYGICPKYLKDILFKKANQEIKKGTPLKFELIEQ